MKDVLLCSQNQLLIKNLYGVLRDEGYGVEIAEHPAFAVKMVMSRHYACVIFDSEPFGMSVEDAVQVLKQIAPDVPVLVMDGDLDAEQVLGAIVTHDPDEVIRTVDEVVKLSA